MEQQQPPPYPKQQPPPYPEQQQVLNVSPSPSPVPQQQVYAPYPGQELVNLGPSPSPIPQQQVYAPGPQQQAYAPGPQQQVFAPGPQQEVINVGPQPSSGPMMVGGFHKFAADTLSVTCPACKNQIMTNVRREVNGAGWVFLIVCFCTLFWPMFLLLCFPFFKRFYHSCPRCGAQVGMGEHTLTGGQIGIIVVVSIISFCVSWIGIWIWMGIAAAAETPSHVSYSSSRYDSDYNRNNNFG